MLVISSQTEMLHWHKASTHLQSTHNLFVWHQHRSKYKSGREQDPFRRAHRMYDNPRKQTSVERLRSETDWHYRHTLLSDGNVSKPGRGGEAEHETVKYARRIPDEFPRYPNAIPYTHTHKTHTLHSYRCFFGSPLAAFPFALLPPSLIGWFLVVWFSSLSFTLRLLSLRP